jgi:hypothetical protein
MTQTLQNLLYLAAAGVILIAGFFILRFALKLAWKIVRLALIMLSLLLVAGFFLGYIDIIIK